MQNNNFIQQQIPEKPDIIVDASIIEKTCPYCKKKSKFKPLDLKLNEIEVYYCRHCDSLMNGF